MAPSAAGSVWLDSRPGVADIPAGAAVASGAPPERGGASETAATPLPASFGGGTGNAFLGAGSLMGAGAETTGGAGLFRGVGPAGFETEGDTGATTRNTDSRFGASSADARGGSEWEAR